MDNIDITDPNFSLSNTNLLSDNTFMNYTNSLWFYIAAVVFILFLGLIFYRYYQNKKQIYNEDKRVEYPSEYPSEKVEFPSESRIE